MNEHVQTDLLAYLDGELDDARRAQVEAHLAQCSECAAELERLQALERDLDTTFDAALSPVRLPGEADARIRERLRARLAPRPWWAGFWQRRGAIAQAALAVMVLFFSLNAALVLRMPAPPPPHQTLVLGQEKLSPGSQTAMRVIVQSPQDGLQRPAPVEGAEVVVQIGRTPGQAQAVFTGQTDANGSADVSFTVPQDVMGESTLFVSTTSNSGHDRISHPITIQRDYRLLLGSDKPVYRPGQTIYARTLALDAMTHQPVAQAIAYQLKSPTGQTLADEEKTASQFGIAAASFTLPQDAEHGQYVLQAQLGDTVSRRTVTVGEYQPPRFRVALETDRPFYAPGQRVTGRITATYFFGQPVANAQVVLRGYTTDPRGEPAIIAQSRTDDVGTANVVFTLPPGFGGAASDQPVALDLSVEVIDEAGQREGIRHFLPVAAQSILIHAVPESGELKPGIENAIFILTSYPDGRPAQTALTAEIEGQTFALETDPYGLAELRYTPSEDAGPLTIQAQDAQGAIGRDAFAFTTDQASAAILLRTEHVIYTVGDTLRAEVLVAGAEEAGIQTLYLDVIRQRQTMATFSAPVTDGRATFALDLDGGMMGTLELHAYHLGGGGDIVRDTRLVIVDAPRQVAVAVSADRETYRPGGTAHLQIQTTITSTGGSTDRPIGTQAALGIGVVDASLSALETLPPGFVRAYFLMEEELAEHSAGKADVPQLIEAQKPQEQAARAAWADVSPTGFTLQEISTARPQQDTAAAARAALVNRLGVTVAFMPLLLGGFVAVGLRASHILGRALKRTGLGLLILFLASPLLALLVGGAMVGLWAAIGVAAPALVLLAALALLTVLLLHGWTRRDRRVQTATSLLAAYLALLTLLVVIAARSTGPTRLLIALVAATFPLALIATAALGQGLVVEGRRAVGWIATALALLLIVLAIYLPFVPQAASDLTRTLGSPALYTGPLGWLAGCAAEATPESVVVTEVVKEEEVVKETEEVAITVTEVVQETSVALPTEEAERVEGTTAAPTSDRPAGQQAEPYPLRQVFPETLYWDPQAVTDESGRLAIDLPLADSITTWRLTALASTRDGALGFATYDLVVFQDIFIELTAPTSVTQGETFTATVTLYNYAQRAQTVRLALAPAEWYTALSPSQTIDLPPTGVAQATFALRAEQSGAFQLQASATGDHASDMVLQEIVVQAAE